MQATSGLHLPQLTSSSLASSSILQTSHPASAQLSEKTYLPILSNNVNLQLQPQPLSNAPHPLPPKEPESVIAEHEGPTDEEEDSATTQGEDMPIGEVIN